MQKKMGLKHTLIVALVLCHYLVSIEAATVKKVGKCAWESEGVTLDLSKVNNSITITGSNGYPYRYYPCEITETWKMNCTPATNAAICRFDQDFYNDIENLLLQFLNSPYTLHFVSQ